MRADIPADRYFPHRRAGFRANPFRALTDAEWSEVAVAPPAIRDAFERGLSHVQILGPAGAGKTSTLLGVQARARSAGQRVAYVYLAEGEDRLTTDLNGLDVLLLDEAQRLSGLERRRLLDRVRASGPRLVLASHADLTDEFSARRLPLASMSLDRLDAGEYREILTRRLAFSALPGRPRASLSDDAVGFLMAELGADRRAADWLLYEVFQDLAGPDTVDAARLRSVRARLGRALSAPGAAS